MVLNMGINDNHTKHLVLVILEKTDQHIALQLRDNITNITHPDHWALFGGHMETGEQPLEAALREVAEELSITLIPSQLAFLRSFQLEHKKEHHAYYYRVDNELTNAQLREGQLYRCLAPDAIRSGYVDQKPVVPSHLEILNWFWAHWKA